MFEKSKKFINCIYDCRGEKKNDFRKLIMIYNFISLLLSFRYNVETIICFFYIFFKDNNEIRYKENFIF